MDTLSDRTLINELADDLSWLEQHSQQSQQGMSSLRLRLAGALVRNCLGPFLDDQPVAPLHVAVMGGAGTGKSTVANMLSGAMAAEANPQAGFTRHPIAFTNASGAVTWTGHLGFLGPLQRLTQPSPSSLDQDVYQVRHVARDETQELLTDFVIWDCPDMTTWAATGYVSRLLEVAGLADIIVYVASDERYNDEVPTEYLKLFVQTGKPVMVCLTKMREADAEAFLAHFKQEVVAHLPGKVVSTMAIPFLTADQLSDPARKAPKQRLPLVNQVAVLGSPSDKSRKRTVREAVGYLKKTRDQILSVAKQDLDALNTWRTLVRTGQQEFQGRYIREYSATEKFRGFDEALVRLMELLDLPGIGKVVSGTLFVLRTPFRWLSGLVGKAIQRPDAASRPELPVLEDSLAGWLDMLRKESSRRTQQHPLWAHISKGFQGDLMDQAREEFQKGLRNFQKGMIEEVDRTARAIYEELEKKPGMLNTLRGSKLALDLAAIGGTVIAGGIGWHDLILVPVVAALTQQLVELFGKSFVDAQREMTRQRQQQLMMTEIAQPLAQWLDNWPVTGGSSFERLQQALQRIPSNLDKLDVQIQAKMA